MFPPQVLLSLERGVWAPNLHFNTPNPEISALTDGRVHVVDRPVPVRGGIVGINSFGFGGSNVHVILRPAERAARSSVEPTTLPRLLLACGRTEAAASAVLQEGKRHGANEDFLSLLNGVSGASASSMPYRGYSVVGSESGVGEVEQAPASVRPLWYICSGGRLLTKAVGGACLVMANVGAVKFQRCGVNPESRTCF